MPVGGANTSVASPTGYRGRSPRTDRLLANRLAGFEQVADLGLARYRPSRDGGLSSPPPYDAVGCFALYMLQTAPCPAKSGRENVIWVADSWGLCGLLRSFGDPGQWYTCSTMV